ncbi:MAG TPA: hypothetical protein PLF72_08620 [Anaerolineaceae bacterium]|nr:hypothetical protein [Anaerolineaceae bacterium]
MPERLGLWVDEDGFVWYNDYRLPMKFIVQEKALEFCPKFDRRRGESRSERIVMIPLADFANLDTSINLQQTKGEVIIVFHKES